MWRLYAIGFYRAQSLSITESESKTIRFAFGISHTTISSLVVAAVFGMMRVVVVLWSLFAFNVDNFHFLRLKFLSWK